MQVYKALLFLLVSFASKAQEHRDSIELISKIYLLDEVSKDLFMNQNYTPNSIFVIKNKILEVDSLKRIFPSRYPFENFIVVLCPRKYLIGYEINYWIQIDEIKINGSRAFILFKIVHSNDNWFQENDVTKMKGELYFVRLNGSWEITKKKIRGKK